MASQMPPKEAMARTNLGVDVLNDLSGADQNPQSQRKKKKYRAGKKVREAKERKKRLVERIKAPNDLLDPKDTQITNKDPLISKIGDSGSADKILATSSDTKTSAAPSCSRCDKNATKHCPRCFEGIDRAGHETKTCYCSAECQKADWASHKKECRHLQDRKQLYRAGETVQSAWYANRQRLFDILIEKIEKRGEDIYIWEGQYKLGQILAAFPAELVSDLKDKQGILTFLACSDGMAYMHDMMKRAIEGICLDVKEVLFLTKSSKRKIHEVLKVTLKDGSTFAFDITGAQYGHYETVFPWDEYSKARIRKVDETNEFGHRAQWLEARSKASDNTIQAAILLTHKQAVKCFNGSSEVWLACHKTTLPDLLRAPKKVYQDKSASFLADVAKEVISFMDAADKRGGVVKVQASWI